MASLLCIKIILTVSYILIILGSLGLISEHKYLFSTNSRVDDPAAYRVWVFSWLLIIAGTIGQLIACWK